MHVEPREGESFDQFVRRFKMSIDKSGILREYKRKRYFRVTTNCSETRPRRQPDGVRVGAARGLIGQYGGRHERPVASLEERAASTVEHSDGRWNAAERAPSASSGQANATRVLRVCRGGCAQRTRISMLPTIGSRTGRRAHWNKTCPPDRSEFGCPAAH